MRMTMLAQRRDGDCPLARGDLMPLHCPAQVAWITPAWRPSGGSYLMTVKPEEEPMTPRSRAGETAEQARSAREGPVSGSARRTDWAWLRW